MYGKYSEFFENVPENIKCKYLKMPEIEIDLNGVLYMRVDICGYSRYI